MSSIFYKAVEATASVLGQKKIYSLDARGLEAFLKKHGGKQNLEPPRYVMRNFSARLEEDSPCPCWIIEPKNPSEAKEKAKDASRAVLFLHGGGFIFGIHAVHWLAVSKLIKRLEIPVWVPLYPLFPQVTIEEMSLVVARVYRRLTEKYSAEDTAVLGDSAGAHLALVLCYHIRAKKIEAGMPAKIVLVSPGMFGEQDPKIIAEMKATEKYDSLLSYSIVPSMNELCNADLSPDNYIYSPMYGNFSGETRFPRTCVFSGTHDIFFPQVPPFVERLKKAGVPCEFVREEGMMHVWPYMPASPESAAAFEKIVRFIA
jgi:acetyl esterase/lipase